MKIRCKKCSRLRPLPTLGPDDCDKCRVETRRHLEASKPSVTVADIQALGVKLLKDSDHRINKYSIEEPDAVKLKLWRHWRKKVRNKIRTCKDGDTMVFPKAPNQED